MFKIILYIDYYTYLQLLNKFVINTQKIQHRKIFNYNVKLLQKEQTRKASIHFKVILFKITSITQLIYLTIQQQLNCSVNQKYYKDQYQTNSAETIECLSECQGDNKLWYEYQIESTQDYVLICSTTKSFCHSIDGYEYQINGTNQCVSSCIEINNFIIKDGLIKYCVESCTTDQIRYVSSKTSECIDQCPISQFSSSGYEYRHPWYYDQNSKERHCSKNEYCPPDTADSYLSKLIYQLQDTNQCQDKECDKVNGTQYILNTGYNVVKMCSINDLCKKSGYYFPDKYMEGYIYCTDKCEQHLWYYYALDEKKYRICDTSEKDELICPPNSPESDEYKYVSDLKKNADLQCVSKCSQSDDYKYTDTKGNCASDCGNYVWSQEDTEDICRDDTECNIKIIPPEYKTQRNQCVECFNGRKYIYNNECQESCQNVYQNYYISNQNQQCVSGCDGNTWKYTSEGNQCQNSTTCVYDEEGTKEYLVEDTKQCIDESIACNVYNRYYTYYKDEINHLCILKNCESSQYSFYQDKYNQQGIRCIQNCDTIWYYYTVKNEGSINRRVNICDTKGQNCPPTLNEGQDYEYTTQLLKISQDKQCIDVCMKTYLYKFTSSQNSQQCIQFCADQQVWYYEENDQQCKDSKQCNFDNNEYMLEINGQCIEENKACLPQDRVLFIKDEKNKICKMNICNYYFHYYLNKYQENGTQCTTRCDGVSYEYPFEYNGKQTFVNICNQDETTCPPSQPDGKEYEFVKTLTKIYQEKCFSNCKEQVNRFYNVLMVSSDGQNRCVGGCSNIWFQKDDDNYCTTQPDCPPQNYQELTKRTENNQCVKTCRGQQQYDKYQENQNMCLESCNKYQWIAKEDDNYCVQSDDEQCNDTEYLVQDTLQCIGANGDCPTNEQKVYIKDQEEYMCILNECYQGKFYEQQYDSQQTQCLDNCGGIWFQQEINQTYIVRICRQNETSCPPNILEGDDQQINKLIYNQDSQCVENCDEQQYYYKSFQIQNYCIRQCSGYQLYATLLLKDNQEYVYCTENYGCSDIQLYPKMQSQTYLDDYYGMRQTVYCVDQCQNDVWYQYINEQYCLEKCYEGDQSYSLNIQTNECAALKEEQCKSLYHLEKNYYDSDCQYIDNVQSCQQYDSYDKYIYNLQQTTICVQCTDSKQFVLYDGLTCVSSCGQNSDEVKYVWYYSQSDVKQCAQQISCPPNNDNLINLKYLLNDTKQCQEQSCKNTQNNKFVKSNAELNVCIPKCLELIYEPEQIAIDQVYYFNETEQENICTEQYTCKAFNDSYIRHSIDDIYCVTQCDDDNVWFISDKEDMIENICTETNKCDLQDIFNLSDKYVDYDKKQDRQCVQKCEQYYYEQDEEKICTQCNQSNQKSEGDKCIIQQGDGEDGDKDDDGKGDDKENNNEDEDKKEDGKISNGAIAGIVVAILVVVVIVMSLIVVIRKKNQKNKSIQKRDVQMNNHDQNIIVDTP